MTTLARPKRVNNMENARPGMVGSVGDAMITGQLATSMPDLPIRWDPVFADRSDNGSLLTPQPYVFDSAWNMGRHEQTAYGLIQQDLRAPDKLHEPTLGVVPQYQWRNKLATVYEAKRTGAKFLPLPGGYQVAPGEMVRGGQVVRTTDIEGIYSVVENQQDSPSVGLAKRNDAMFRKQFGMNAKKINSKLGSPIVSNPARPSVSSTSSNFKLMDPRNLASPTNPFSFGE